MEKRRTLVISLAVTAVLLLLIGGYFFGYGWRVEWDTRSGKQRTVHAVFGLRIGVGELTSTILSDWRSSEPSEANWVKVASGPTHGALVNYCYPKVLGHLMQVEWMIRDPDQRQTYATWILADLEENEKVCDLSRHCTEVTDAMFDDAMFDIDVGVEGEPLTDERLKLIWTKPKTHNKAWVDNPLRRRQLEIGP